MNRVALLLDAVVDDPTDLPARLVYADALQDIGDPRGRFIALHIEGSPEADAMLKTHRKAWSAFLRPAVTRGYRFINGFIERISLQPQYLDRLPGLMRQSPIHQVRFRDLKRDADTLAKMHDCTRRLSWLDLKQGHVSGGGFAELMTAPWPRLKRIWVPSNPIGRIGIEALLDAQLPELVSLNLHGTGISESTARRLAEWERIGEIAELNLRGNTLSDEVLADICRQGKRLTWLGLPTLGRQTALALSSRFAEMDSLVIQQFDDAEEVTDLLERLVDKVEYVDDYTSSFDFPWP